MATSAGGLLFLNLAGLGPHPRTPTSASCGECSQRAEGSAVMAGRIAIAFRACRAIDSAGLGSLFAGSSAKVTRVPAARVLNPSLAHCCGGSRPRDRQPPRGSRTRRFIKPYDRSDRLLLVVLHLSLQAANLILQAPARSLKRVVDRKRQDRRGAHPPLARAMLTSRRSGKASRMFTSYSPRSDGARPPLEHHAAGRHATASLFQLRQ